MNDQDPTSAQLNLTDEKVIYDIYCQQQPDLIEEINVLIRTGHTPLDIKNFVRLVTPATSQLANHVYLLASYLLRQQISQN